MGAANWTCDSGGLRWFTRADGTRELQQLMERDGYVAQWRAVPEAVTIVPTTAATAPADTDDPEDNTPAQQLAVAIARHIFNVGSDSQLGRPSRLAYKYRYGITNGCEQEGGGLGPVSLAAVIREAIRQHTADEACRPQA